MKKWLIFPGLILVASFTMLYIGYEKKSQAKINGVSFEAPPKAVGAISMESIRKTRGNWVAITPYAFIQPDNPRVIFDHPRQWWGERSEGVVSTIRCAQQLGYQVMLKPHVWVRGQGWPGDLEIATEKDWKLWSESYKAYIMTYATIADSLEVPLLCIGTEFRKLAVKKPLYWQELIKKVRKAYSGKLTYAANWDNYENIDFWSDLDYIGIDAYFPLSQQRVPSKAAMMEHWQEIGEKLQDFASLHNTPVLFTEYGYQSVDYAVAGHWQYDQDSLHVNLQLQADAYEALFKSVWHKDWIAGGFLWKWHAQHEQAGGPDCKKYTPQNKPALEVIARWYNQN
ncbi:MAG: hypothetical protein R3345_05625 [Fulvivirga sp.]|nr:hypothetical protein [Fulvivirga sp.]